MIVEKVILKNFRNYSQLDLSFNPKMNFIIGGNAQGKTNLIESIYISSIGKSFRTLKDQEMIMFGKKACLCSVFAKNEIEDINIQIKILKGKKKEIKKNGKALSRVSEMINNIFIVIFSPEDLRIVKDDPEKRRNFIDREICQISPVYAVNLSYYKKALNQRNSYLKKETIKNRELEVWDEELVKYGYEIIKRRKDFIKKINLYSKKIHSGITGQMENLEIKYLPDIITSGTEEESKKNYRETILGIREKDIKLRTTTKGPHRDDIEFIINGTNMRNFGSQGQQRTCALSLKLAEINIIEERTGENPILILDDVMSELDKRRQEFLIRTLKGSQIFITGTELDKETYKKFPDSTVMKVSSGEVKIINNK